MYTNKQLKYMFLKVFLHSCLTFFHSTLYKTAIRVVFLPKKKKSKFYSSLFCEHNSGCRWDFLLPLMLTAASRSFQRTLGPITLAYYSN